ncbi:hypothetical protein CMT41_00580 [Colwellia sp. MT41]|uniref:helix-turn-helix transcriptional regulator n=1 Tax=Colwellia sp. MT41 TaxID=58049 RepID=UPI000717AFD5|nr:helix-turn-helix transcriptional regulator [Colwellia sp. MT41]ALO33371.1 hypothetical protein CMT41_00580 [Colwellia sp. MT41]
MARVKPYNQYQFQLALNGAIDNLIIERQALPEGSYRDIYITEIAKYFNIDVATLRRWCAEYCQKSPKEYLARYRISLAKQKLRQGIKSSVVAKELAFTEHKIFCSVFKRYENQTPSKLSQAC